LIWDMHSWRERMPASCFVFVNWHLQTQLLWWVKAPKSEGLGFIDAETEFRFSDTPSCVPAPLWVS
jgi:hypothetical protein